MSRSWRSVFPVRRASLHGADDGFSRRRSGFDSRARYEAINRCEPTSVLRHTIAHGPLVLSSLDRNMRRLTDSGS